MKILFASHTAQVGAFRVGSHHLSRELAALGHEVGHVSTQVTLGHLTRLRDSRVRERFALALRSPRRIDGVTHSVPLTWVPGELLRSSWSARQLRHPILPWGRIFGDFAKSRPDVLLVDQPELSGLIDLARPRLVVYRPTDSHFDGKLRAKELSLLRRVDGVVATSRAVLDRLKPDILPEVPTLVIENGVELKRFTNATGVPERSGVVYVGALDHRFDWGAVCRLAEGFPEERFTIAGPIPKQHVAVPANVKLLGAVPYAEVPRLLNGSRVGLLPMSADQGNAGRSPMKYYEYLAAGLYVVADSTETLKTRAAPGVFLYQDHDSAGTALGDALSERPVNVSGVAYAKDFDWASRASDLIEFLERLARNH